MFASSFGIPTSNLTVGMRIFVEFESELGEDCIVVSAPIPYEESPYDLLSFDVIDSGGKVFGILSPPSSEWPVF